MGVMVTAAALAAGLGAPRFFLAFSPSGSERSEKPDNSAFPAEVIFGMVEDCCVRIVDETRLAWRLNLPCRSLPRRCDDSFAGVSRVRFDGFVLSFPRAEAPHVTCRRQFWGCARRVNRG